MAIKTITIDSKTIPAPTRLNAYPPGATTLHLPVDGAAIAQVSNNRDTQGTMNTVRSLEWDAIPLDSGDWTLSIDELKALEGQNTTIQATSVFSNIYNASTNIKIINVDPVYLRDADYGGTSKAWFSLTVNYVHR
jgi:hypothetical protein